MKKYLQGTYASGKCQGNLKIFKVRELSGNFIICQGKLNFAKMSGKCQGILEFQMKFRFSNKKKKKRNTENG